MSSNWPFCIKTRALKFIRQNIKTCNNPADCNSLIEIKGTIRFIYKILQFTCYFLSNPLNFERRYDAIFAALHLCSET